MGLNTFFEGSSAMELSVNSDLKDDPSKFAASRGGIGNDTENGVTLANFLDLSLESQNGDSLSVLYTRFISETVQGATVASATAESARVFETSLQGQKAATSGVNLDEEAVQMLAYQRSYQATSKYISTLSDLFEVLVNL